MRNDGREEGGEVPPLVSKEHFRGKKNIAYRKHQNDDCHAEESFDGGQ